MLIFITEAGRSTELEKPYELDLFKGFSEDELKELVDLTQRMVENAEAAFPPDYLEEMKDMRKRREEFFDSAKCGNHDFRPPMGMGPGGCGPRGGHCHHHHHHDRIVHSMPYWM